MPYSPDHKPKTRMRIINAASALFKKNGFEHVTIDQVMAHAGLTRGGFYAHFKNKEDLFVACVENGMSLLAAPVLAKLRKAERAGEDWMTSFAELYLSRLHVENPEMGCALPTLSVEVSRSGLRAQKAFSKLINQASEKLAWKLAKEDNAPDKVADKSPDKAPDVDMLVDTLIEPDQKRDNVPDHYQQDAAAILAMMVGAVVLSRAVDRGTSDHILAAARETISHLHGNQSSSRTRKAV